MAKDSPFEPPSDLRQWAKHVHNMFIALVDEGFEESQAFTFLAIYMAALGGCSDDDQT